METNNYILYKVYIDGILTIFDSRKTNEKQIFSEKNKTHRNFQLKLSQQDHNTNFLYLKIKKHSEHLYISIDRKLTIKIRLFVSNQNTHCKKSLPRTGHILLSVNNKIKKWKSADFRVTICFCTVGIFETKATFLLYTKWHYFLNRAVSLFQPTA